MGEETNDFEKIHKVASVTLQKAHFNIFMNFEFL